MAILVEKTLEKNQNYYKFRQGISRPAKGNYFYGGAGMNGGYIDDMVLALKEAGILHVKSGYKDKSIGHNITRNLGISSAIDAATVLFYNHSNRFAGLHITLTAKDFDFDGSQFNLIGYSYGSIIACHIALIYTKLYKGEIDHLVLIGSPITQSLLNKVQKEANVKKIIILDLTDKGDPIKAGITNAVLVSKVPTLIEQMNSQTGHFHYALMNSEGAIRRRALAKHLYTEGLR